MYHITCQTYSPGHPESDDISPYATTGSITVHAENTPSEYAYASVKELKVLPEDEGRESYDKLDLSAHNKAIRKPVPDGLYGALQDDGSYDDASSCLIDVPVYDDASSSDLSGYAKMSPSLNTRKTSSLKNPKARRSPIGNPAQSCIFEAAHKGTTSKRPRENSRMKTHM